MPTVRIHFPLEKLVSSVGKQLPASVERCPCCLLEFRDVPKDFSVPDRYDPAIDAAPLPEPPMLDEIRTMQTFSNYWPMPESERTLGTDSSKTNLKPNDIIQIGFEFERIVKGFR
ncbi:hypothetical protein ABFT51_20820 [Paenibacillus peoriae]|uniref:hypothetical protein n=1 Tax=Paenibacillus peoriae TaxID=59893 RepID=UPI0032B01E44